MAGTSGLGAPGHVSTGALQPDPAAILSAPRLDADDLPPAVARIRSRILQATRSGQIDDLLIPIQWNEVRPLFQLGQPLDFDPIGFLARRSFDGRGREMLAILSAVFRSPHAVLTRGMTRSYVWPVFPAVPDPTPWPQEHLPPWGCVRFADLAAGAVADRLIHRAAIGPDGTWHYFWTEDSGWAALAPGGGRR